VLLGKTTITEATGAGATVEGTTVSVARPLWSPRVAIMSAVPRDNAVTSPESETVATEVLLELQTTTRFSIRFCESLKTAVAFVVWPTSSVLRARVTVADATRDASAVESFRVRLVGSVVDLSEHDKMMQ